MLCFLSFYCLIKLNKMVFFYKDLGFILFFYIVVLLAFGLSSTCYDMVLLVILLQYLSV